MALQVVKAYPPNYDQLDQAFQVRGRRGVLFTYGAELYNPDGIDVPAWLMMHEEVHSVRQRAHGNLVKWWADYIADPRFRFAEELPAHIAEWKGICRHVNSRELRSSLLHQITIRLSGSLYGNMVNYKTARELILEGVK